MKFHNYTFNEDEYRLLLTAVSMAETLAASEQAGDVEAIRALLKKLEGHTVE